MYKLMARSVWLKLMRKRQTLSVIIFECVCFENNAPLDTLQTNVTLSSMPDISFDCVDITTGLKKLNINKSEGPDGIHQRVLSENAEILAYPLKIILEKLFTLNALPLDWRSGNIINIFKKGNKLEPGNYEIIDQLAKHVSVVK